MQSLHIRQYNFEKTYCTNTIMKSHNIVSKKRIMQLYYISILQNKNSIKKQKFDQKKTNNIVKNKSSKFSKMRFAFRQTIRLSKFE